MVAKAYSFKLNDVVKEEQLKEYFQTEKLTDIYDFRCIDIVCSVPLTAKCVHSVLKKPHFAISQKNNYHDPRCTAVEYKESKQQSGEELDSLLKTMRTGKIATLTGPKYSTKISEKISTDQNDSSTFTRKTPSSSEKLDEKTRKQNDQTSNLETMVNLWQKAPEEIYKISFPFENKATLPNISNNRGVKKINDIFYSIHELIPINSFYIFHGLAHLEVRKKTMVVINFFGNSGLTLYTNLTKILQLPEKEIIYEALENHEPIYVFCEGAILDQKNKYDEQVTRLMTVSSEAYRSILFKESNFSVTHNEENSLKVKPLNNLE